MQGGAQLSRSPKSLTQRCDDYQDIKFHLVATLLSPFLVVCSQRAQHWAVFSKNDLISILFYSSALLFYHPPSSQWLCGSVQFFPHLILFYCRLTALLFRYSSDWRRQEKLCPFSFPEKKIKHTADHRTRKGFLSYSN